MRTPSEPGGNSARYQSYLPTSKPQASTSTPSSIALFWLATNDLVANCSHLGVICSCCQRLQLGVHVFGHRCSWRHDTLGYYSMPRLLYVHALRQRSTCQAITVLSINDLPADEVVSWIASHFIDIRHVVAAIVLIPALLALQGSCAAGARIEILDVRGSADPSVTGHSSRSQHVPLHFKRCSC